MIKKNTDNSISDLETSSLLGVHEGSKNTVKSGIDNDSIFERLTVRAQHMVASDREANIIERAIEYFAVHGFSVSTRELAKHIGVTQPLIYRYFGSKECLIERVHQEVFFTRWNPEWEAYLSDKSRPIEARLNGYLKDYTDAIMKNDWIRLFVFSALSDPTLNQEYIGLLKQRIFIPLLKEMRQAYGLPDEPSEMDIELFWGFHSSFFYMGMRRWVYRMDVPDNISDVIKVRVQHFLYGYNALLNLEKQELKQK